MVFAGTHNGSKSYGLWKSNFMWDANGYSEVWTSNNYGKSAWYTLTVKRANGSNIGYAKVYISNKKIYTHGCWGQPFLDRQGQVNGPGPHYPGFAS